MAFDPSRLSYVGQPSVLPAVLVGPAPEAGRIRFVVVDARGLPAEAATFVFEIRGEGYESGLRLEVEALAAPNGIPYRVRARQAAAFEQADGVPAGSRPMALADWVALVRARGGPRPGPARLPGDGLIYGDVNLDGAVNVFDLLGVANVIAGNLPLLTGLTPDFVLAGDIAPSNLPGLGEADDPIPPGVDADGSRSLNVFDALAIANYAAANGNPVAGQPIPGHGAVAVGRVTLSGVIGANRTLSRDTVYQLDGTVIVPNGVTLTIQPGTRLEGDPATRGALSIRRGGQLQALGTRNQPIVLSCAGAAPAAGCWGGLIVNGAAPLNRGSGGGFLSCPELTEPSGGIYGGCLTQHSSGGIGFVRIEYAGASWPAGSPTASLALNGVGSATFIADIQISHGAGVGIAISGGRAALREILTDQTVGGLSWDDGWRGEIQTVLVYRSAGTSAALRGSNSATDPTATPRAHPTIYGLTIAEPSSGPTPGAPAILLEQGTGGRFRNLILTGWAGTGLDINGSATCERIASDSLDVSSGVFFGNGADFAADSDCADEAGFGIDPMRLNLFADPLLLDRDFSVYPDFRFAIGSPATTGSVPPADGFLDPTRTYRGAVPEAGASRGAIPWYAGWTRWQ